jgi:hypothetical protein
MTFTAEQVMLEKNERIPSIPPAERPIPSLFDIGPSVPSTHTDWRPLVSIPPRPQNRTGRLRIALAFSASRAGFKLPRKTAPLIAAPPVPVMREQGTPGVLPKPARYEPVPGVSVAAVLLCAPARPAPALPTVAFVGSREASRFCVHCDGPLVCNPPRFVWECENCDGGRRVA